MTVISPKLIKTFKASASANTQLMKLDDIYFVRKHFPPSLKTKLLFQFEWYNLFSKSNRIPDVIQCKSDDPDLYLDLEYISNSDTFSNYSNIADSAECIATLDSVINYLQNSIHQEDTGEHLNSTELEKYIDLKVTAKVKEASNLSKELKLLSQHDQVVINNNTFKNVEYYIDIIKSKINLIAKTIPQNIGPIHGDLTLENILIQNKEFYIIDPNNENINSIAADYAKILQSLDSNYEAHLKYSNYRLEENHLFYPVDKSKNYSEMLNYFWNRIDSQFDDRFRTNLRLHLAIHLSRLLPYLGRNNMKSIIIFYAEMIRNLEQFISEI